MRILMCRYGIDLVSYVTNLRLDDDYNHLCLDFRAFWDISLCIKYETDCQGENKKTKTKTKENV